jgi:plasmid stabilization system protein ParE
MPLVTWSVRALADIDRLEAFLRDKSPDAAERAVSAILDATESLQDFPLSGRPVAGMSLEYRELPVAFGIGGYVVFYRQHEEDVHILAVRHMREASY